jgi:hypothetical protein
MPYFYFWNSNEYLLTVWVRLLPDKPSGSQLAGSNTITDKIKLFTEGHRQKIVFCGIKL